MDILFLNPSSKNYYKKLGMNLMPLGLAYLTSVLRLNGHMVSVVDLLPEFNSEQQIRSENYDIVGISSDTPRLKMAIQLGQQIRKSGKPVIFGGPHTTFMDREPIEEEAADFVVRGEGETVLCELLHHMEHGIGLEKVRGITYRLNGKILRNENSPLIDDLDSLPFPARDIFDPRNYLHRFDRKSMATMLTSRGCPYDCFFCAASRLAGKKWRTRSLDSIFTEMEQLITEKYGAFIFVDDNFTLDYKRVMDFCEEIIYRRWDISWWCFSRTDIIVKHPDMVKKMALAGNRSMFLGLESGNQNTLDYYNKKTSLQQQISAIHILKENGIRVFGSFILGEIHETEEMVNETIHFARKLNPDRCQFSLLTPYPGSELFEQLDRDQKIISRNWDTYDGAHMVFESDHLSALKLEKLFRKAYFRFYIRMNKFPAIIKEIFKNPLKIVHEILMIFYGFSIFKELKKGKSRERKHILEENQNVSIQWK